MASYLTENAVSKLGAMSVGISDGSFQPTLQVLTYRLVNNDCDRYRIVLSDSEYFIQGILVPELNILIENNELCENSIVELKSFIIKRVPTKTTRSNNKNNNNNKIVVIVTELIVIRGACSQGLKIGNPKNYSTTATTISSSYDDDNDNKNTTTQHQSPNNKYDTRTMKTRVEASVGNNNNNSNSNYNSVGQSNVLRSSPTSPMKMSTSRNNCKSSQNPYSSPSKNPYNNTSSPSKNPYSNSSSSSSPRSATKNPYSKSARSLSSSLADGAAPIVRQQQQQQSPSGKKDKTRYTAIKSLNMYQNRWIIKGRVTGKTDIRTWSNAKGEGKLFSIEILDNQQMDIRATFFQEAVDRFYNLVHENHIYTFSGGRIKVANQRYNTCKSQFELSFDSNSEIHLVPTNNNNNADNDDDIIKQQFDLCKISDIEKKETNSFIDVLAVVREVGTPTQIVSKKSGQELTKCDLILVDDTNVEINLTLWGVKAIKAPVEYSANAITGIPPIVVFRRARVSDFNGKSLSLSGSAIPEPDIPEKYNLRQWWKDNGQYNSNNSTSLSSGSAMMSGKPDNLLDRKDVATIKLNNLGQNPIDGKADWISFKGMLNYIKRDKEGGAWYPACPNSGEPCRNLYKVIQTTDGYQWHCDKCGKTYPDCTRRWIFSAVVYDDTSSTWVSFFNDQAETLLENNTANIIYEKTMDPENPNIDQYDALFLRNTYTEWIFKCRVKNEIINDETRIKTTVYALYPVDYVKESNEILAAIENF